LYNDFVARANDCWPGSDSAVMFTLPPMMMSYSLTDEPVAAAQRPRACILHWPTDGEQFTGRLFDVAGHDNPR
jgi:hypothetical protein